MSVNFFHSFIVNVGADYCLYKGGGAYMQWFCHVYVVLILTFCALWL
jgi:hypothetical protein